MALLFNSSNALKSSSSPLNGIGANPCTFGMWFNASSTANSPLIEISDDSANFITLCLGAVGLAPGELAYMVIGSGGFNAVPSSFSINTDNWTFVVGRTISAASLRIDVWDPLDTHGITADQVAGSFTSVGATPNLYFGGDPGNSIGNPFEGALAEAWVTNNNIGAGDTALDPSLLYKLAIEGPFAIPHIAQNILLYQGFRTNPLDPSPEDQYYPRSGESGLTLIDNGGSLTTINHPPYLSSLYKRPNQYTEFLVV